MQTGLTTEAETAAHSRPANRVRALLGAALLSLICVVSTPLLAASPGGNPLEEQIISPETSYPTANPRLMQRSAATATSAADLSLFGILALGIIGLLWVRRHTSEL